MRSTPAETRCGSCCDVREETLLPQLIARVMRELRRGEAEAEARDAEVTVRAAEQVRDVLHYADWLTAKFSRWALFGDVYSVLLLAQDRKVNRDVT